MILCCLVGGEATEPTLPAGDAQPEAFRSEDLVIPTGELQLAATLYLPQSAKPAPAVVFVHGAARAVRSDGYHELARHFASKGVAALIYDKRGCGASTGDWTKAGMYDLADDALACVRWLRGRTDVNPAQVGLWGLSQGASIIPIAAGRDREVAFVIAVGGCLDFEAQMRYFLANLFRRRGLSPAALDVANKTFMLQVDFVSRVRAGTLPAPQSLRESCRFEFDLDQAAVWGQVRQPILAIYGARDQHVPVAEHSAMLARAVAQSGHRDFTLVIYPDASHSIGKTQTGKLGEKWTGYVPEYLEDMTDWIGHVARGDKWPARPQQVQVAEADQPFAAERYERLKWYGNAPVQIIQFLVLAMTFLMVAIGGTIAMVRGLFRHNAAPASGPRRWLVRVATALSIVNLTLLTGFVALIAGLADQREPAYPEALNWLPLVGTLSAGLALTFLALLVASWRASADAWRRRLGWALFAACALAFVPFLHYWNLLGVGLR
jgi:hypothetical protein